MRVKKPAITLAAWSKQSSPVKYGVELLGNEWKKQSKSTSDLGSQSSIRYSELFIIKSHGMDFTVWPLLQIIFRAAQT